VQPQVFWRVLGGGTEPLGGIAVGHKKRTLCQQLKLVFRLRYGERQDYIPKVNTPGRTAEGGIAVELRQIGLAEELAAKNIDGADDSRGGFPPVVDRGIMD